MTKMPFGKHKGKELRDVPISYLQWVLENVTKLSETLRRDIERVVSGENRVSERPVQRDGYRPSEIIGGNPSDAINEGF